jgi:hypothetical protein
VNSLVAIEVLMRIGRLAVLAAGLAAACLVAAETSLRAQVAPRTPAITDLDTFMARVLERRNENWRTLHDYILSERETFQIFGPGDILLVGQRREFQWFIRDGYLVRSPIKANGATLGASDRAKYENEWLTREKEREKKAKDTSTAQAKKQGRDAKAVGDEAVNEIAKEVRSSDPEAEKEVATLVGGEPRFISEAYFMKFPFEPGNYYLAGRETLDGREVVKVEYYPSKMFKDDEERSGTEVSMNARGDVKVTQTDQKAKGTAKKPAPNRHDKNDDMDQEIERAMNKVTLVTMWIDPVEHQIVRFTFDNVDFNFLPGRAIVRVDEAKASMTMGRYFENVWLPREILFRAAATVAAGSYTFRYAREFSDYRKGEVSARIRAYVPKEP